MRSLCVMFLVVCVAGFACSAYATSITANGVAQFYDNFETVSVGDLPDNGVQPGDWTFNRAGGSVVTVASPVSEGAQSMRIIRANGGDVYAYANLATAQTTPGTLIHAEWMEFVPTASGYQSFISLQDSGANICAGLLTNRHSSGGIEALTSSGWTDQSVIYAPDTWQKWTLDYTVGGTSFTFGVHGTSTTVTAPGSGAVTRLAFAGNADGSTYYIDAVPEPSTIVLMVTGLVGLLAYAWRRRR